MTFHAIGILKAEILVDVENGTEIEDAARQYLVYHPEALKMTAITCDPKKIRAMKKAGCIPYPLGGRRE